MEPKKRRIRQSMLVIDGTEYRFSAPGFKKADRGEDKPPDYYWQAADDAVDAGYPTKTVPLEIDFSDPQSAIDRIEQRCRELQAEMLAWLDGDRDDRAQARPQIHGQRRVAGRLLRFGRGLGVRAGPGKHRGGISRLAEDDQADCRKAAGRAPRGEGLSALVPRMEEALVQTRR